MAQYTPNLGLIKPAGSDNVAVQQLNANMDVLDEVVHENTEKIDRIRIVYPPYIDENTGHWMIYDPDTGNYADSGYSAIGRPATFTARATTLPAGSDATASMSGTAENPVLNIGVPRGDTAGLGTPSASVDANVGVPSVAVTATGPDTAKQFSFEFHNLKGEPGASTAEAAQYAASAAASAELAAQHVYNIDVVGHTITVTQQQHGFTMTVVGTKVVVADAT